MRELHNIVERIGILSTRPEIDADAVAKLMGTPAHPQAGGSRAWQELLDNHGDFQAFKEAAETEFIRHQLRRHEWNISATADAIGIMRSHLYNKINKYRLER